MPPSVGLLLLLARSTPTKAEERCGLVFCLVGAPYFLGCEFNSGNPKSFQIFSEAGLCIQSIFQFASMETFETGSFDDSLPGSAAFLRPLTVKAKAK